MSKFSVKKPLTVFVAVIMVLVLGVVSYTRMTPDLFPSIDLPYVLVMTPYPGATPEKVEQSVTKPMEQAMATLENIRSVSSSSASNYSTVILEFTEDANMDSITVDILQKVNQIEGVWDDMVGTPTILKINPNMLPVMVAAVNVEGMDTAALSAFVEDDLLPALEGTKGVASITAAGLLEETVEVTLEQAKIDKLNKTLRKQIDKSIDEAKAELDDAKAEIESGQAELESGKAQLEDGKDQLNEQTAAAEEEISNQQTQLQDAKLEIKLQIAQLKDQLATLEQTESILRPIHESLLKLVEEAAALAEEQAVLEGLAEKLAALEELYAEFEDQIVQIQIDPELTKEQIKKAIAKLKESEEYLAMEAAFAEIEAQLAARGLTEEELAAEIARLEEAFSAVQENLGAVDEALGELDLSRDVLGETLEEMEAGKTQLTDGIEMLETMLTELDAGQLQLSAALKELETQKTAAMFEMNAAAAQLAAGEMQLNAALTQVEQGLDAVEDGRETAYDSADLNDILTMETMSSLLMAQNFAMPAGYAEDDQGANTMVSVGDTIGSLEELQNVVLLDLNIDGVKPITLADVATVNLVDNRDEIYARVNGNDGVLLTFSKQSTYATAEVSKYLQEKFEVLCAEHEGLAFTSLMDQGDYIYMIVDSIIQNLFLSAVFAVLILFLFLKDIRPTFITLCSIPLSVLFAIVLMYFTGVTLNMISMSALAVSIGMLVDNSIVVIENVYRLRRKGVDVIRAAVAGAEQVAGAIMASTLTTVCVFLPIVFVEGLTRQLFMDMALTLGYALVASLIVAMTLVPAMSAKMFAKATEKRVKWMEALARGYRKALDKALHRKVLVLIVTAVLLVVSAGLTLMRGFIFMPTMSSTEMTVTIETEKGSEAAYTKQITDEVMERVMTVEGVKTVGAMLSSDSLTGSESATSATMYVILDEEYMKQSFAIADQINALCADMDATVTADGSGMSSMMTMLTGAGVSINVYGDDLDVLQATASDIAKKLGEAESLENISDGMEETDPELHFAVDKQKAAEKGLTVAQVYAEIASALTTEATATTLTENGKEYDVLVIASAALSPEELKDYTFTVTGKDGEETEVVLGDIAKVEETRAARTINRSEQRRFLTVSAEVKEGHNVTLAAQEAEKLLADFSLPKGVTIEFAGETEGIMEALEQLLLMALLGILLVYLIMVAQFQSLKSPFIVMFTIPLAFTGGFLALLITGNELSVISMIGFVMLCGIIVNNGIVLVDYINQLRADGMAKRDALLEAGTTRLRPILMTTVTTVLGLLLTAIGFGSGAEMMQPIAIVSIGGLTYATLMTLFVVPVMYDLFNRKEMNVVRDEDMVYDEDSENEE